MAYKMLPFTNQHKNRHKTHTYGYNRLISGAFKPNNPCLEILHTHTCTNIGLHVHVHTPFPQGYRIKRSVWLTASPSFPRTLSIPFLPPARPLGPALPAREEDTPELDIDLLFSTPHTCRIKHTTTHNHCVWMRQGWYWKLKKCEDIVMTDLNFEFELIYLTGANIQNNVFYSIPLKCLGWTDLQNVNRELNLYLKFN